MPPHALLGPGRPQTRLQGVGTRSVRAGLPTGGVGGEGGQGMGFWRGHRLDGDISCKGPYNKNPSNNSNIHQNNNNNPGLIVYTYIYICIYV